MLMHQVHDMMFQVMSWNWNDIYVCLKLISLHVFHLCYTQIHSSDHKLFIWQCPKKGLSIYNL